MKVCFLILHYNEISLTERAVQSIVEMDKVKDDKPIVVVDNCSPNGSGRELVDVYEAKLLSRVAENECIDLKGQENITYVNEDKNIHIILNGENSGFARGNNLGYRYIRDYMDVDFVIALNNDISFPQKNFVTILENIYKSEPVEKRFYLAGPDVWTPNIRSHISPLDVKFKDESDVIKRFDFISQACDIYKKRFDLTTFIRFIQDKYQGTRLLKMYNRIRRGEYDGATKYNEVAYGCVLNGACLIFDRRYIDEYDILFDEATFLYAEEDFLTYRLVKDGKSIRYCPELKVDHVGQGASGFNKLSYREYCNKNILTQHRIKESFEKYLAYIQGDIRNEDK